MVEGLPGRGRHSQPTVLVSGRALELLREVPLQLFGDRAASGDGVVVATSQCDPAFVGRRLAEQVSTLDAGRIALVNCFEGEADPPSWPSEREWDVSSPASFDEVEAGIQSARQYVEDCGVSRCHFLVDTLTVQFQHAADRGTVLGHADDLAMSLGAEDGLTVFGVDPATVSDHEHERLRHLFDVHVEVRRGEDDPELRWTGLVDRSDDWLPFADAGICFDATG